MHKNVCHYLSMCTYCISICCVQGATYGRQSKTVCWTSNMEDENESLTSDKYPRLIKVVFFSSRCDYKSECTVQSSNTLAGDLCLGTHKYLSASYQFSYTSIMFCFRLALCNKYMLLYHSIVNEKTIRIVSAVYGRQEQNVCWSFMQLGTKQTIVIFYRCKYKTTCYIRVNNATMGGDPCPGTYKYLSVTAQCV
uniref:SUEL-type lectin domain-containing protein n=1 Tax=Anabas testudineus TaxID=64144 RepID=A0A3Q1I3B3_ANATE